MKTFLFFIACSLGLNLNLQSKPTLNLTMEPEQKLVFAGSPQDVVIKIDLTGTSSRLTKRTPLNVAVVLDRSGSMGGAKIEKAKQAAAAIVDQLSSKDIFSLVAYDTSVQVLVPAQPVEDKDMLKSRIERIQPGGSTALYEGVERGAVELGRYLSHKKINRVLLLSDGLANVGPSSTPEISELGRRLAARGIAVSTIGLGDDYNEDLMTALAQASDANYYYVRDVEELPAIFAKELGQLLSVVARNVRVRVICPEGVEPIGFIGRDETFKNGEATIEFSPFASGQNRYLFLRCHTSGNSKKSQQLARVEVNYADELNEGKNQSVTQETSIRFTKNSEDAQKSQNKDVYYQKELMLNALAKDEAIRKADSGNYTDAKRDLEQQAQKLREMTAAAPASMQDSYRSEAENLAAKSREVDATGVSSSWRKSMQVESYQQKNAK